MLHTHTHTLRCVFFFFYTTISDTWKLSFGCQFAQLPCTTMNQSLLSFMEHSSKCWSDNLHKNVISVVLPSNSPAALQEVPSFETLSAEMESLKRHLLQIDSPTVLCHNDLLTKNIIYNHKEGEEQPCTLQTVGKSRM